MDTFTRRVSIAARRHDPAISKWGTVPDGYKSGVVELTIDIDKLAKLLGQKALGSSGGRSQMAKGCIKAVVHSVVHTREGQTS